MSDSLLINFDRHRPAHLTRAASASTAINNLTSTTRPFLTHSHSASALLHYRTASFGPQSGPGSSLSGESEPGGARGEAERGPKRRYECLERDCGKTFSTSGHRSRHHKIHKGEAEKRWVCPFPDCTSKFTRKDNQTQHYKTHFPRPAKGPRSLKLIGRPKTVPSAAPNSPPTSTEDVLMVAFPPPPLRLDPNPALPSPLVSPAVAPAPEALAPLDTGLLLPATPLSVPGSGFTFGSPSFPQFPTPPSISGVLSGVNASREALGKLLEPLGTARASQFATPVAAPATSPDVPHFAAPPNSPPPWFGFSRGESQLSPVQGSGPSRPDYEPSIEIRLEESCTLDPQLSPVRPSPLSLSAAPAQLAPVDHRAHAAGLMITPAGFDAGRRAFSLAEPQSARQSPNLSESSALDAAARRWSWQSGLPSMAMLSSPADGSLFSQAQAAVMAQSAYTGHFGTDGGSSGLERGLSTESFGSMYSSDPSQVGSIFDSRSGSFSSRGEESAAAVNWSGGSQTVWTPTKSVGPQHVLGPYHLVQSPASMSPVRSTGFAWSPIQPFQPAPAKLGIPSLHLSTQPITHSLNGIGNRLLQPPVTAPPVFHQPPDWRVMPLEPAPILDGYNEV